MFQADINKQVACKMDIRGIVQGVGFRPFVYSQALNYKLAGWVRNTSAGVEIHIQGDSKSVDNFISTFRDKVPPLARIDKLDVSPAVIGDYSSFEIISSKVSENDFIPISPDVTICNDCLTELFDPADRRYRYPFINCTNCGPRFSIIKNIPYDRPNTTMAGFEMCPDCRKEYENPLDRRFHAQPIACPNCGPQVEFFEGTSMPVREEQAIKAARLAIIEGKIIAVKGLGGVHLVCDASNSTAVNLLRTRKKRSEKSFALMANDLKVINKYCFVSDDETALLQSNQHPIVLLDQNHFNTLADGIAPNQLTFGFMLPYTPLHYLLIEPADGFPDVLVMTSGNISDEPIAYKDDEIVDRLSGLADGFLIHNRSIHTRIDDSVVRFTGKSTSIIRRARGYVPVNITLPKTCPRTLGTGAELKNTFCLTRDEYGFISHHIGDMENFETYLSFEEGIAHFENIFRVTPEILACDLHPDYLATKYAINRSISQNIPLIQVQHHHAHLAACLADNGWKTDDPVIGLCFDGTGYGTDHSIWGGEIFIGGYKNYQRAYHLLNVPLPGGDVSIHKTARIALSYLHTLDIPWDVDIPSVAYISQEEKSIVQNMIGNHINTPLTSSMGRLFDAVSSLVGIRHEVNYEGQGAIELENRTDLHENGLYGFSIDGNIINLNSMVNSIIRDYRDKTPVSTISARFHNTLVELCLELCLEIQHSTGIGFVALSGGVWQNRILFNRVTQKIRENGLTILSHHQVPCNDGCISLGQVLVASSVS